MMSFLPLLLTVLLGLASCDASTQNTPLYKAARGVVIRSMYRGSVSTEVSKLICIWLHCDEAKHCAVAFHRQSGQCVGVSTAAWDILPVLANTGVLFTASNDSDWTAVVSGGLEVKTDGPAALWLLDDEFRGGNLGTKGALLNMTETGLLWSSTGPRGVASSRRYARLTSSNRATVQLLHDGKYTLKLTQPFTMATWVRTDNVTGVMPIIDGKIEPTGKHKVSFWFWPDTYQSQLHVNLGRGHSYFNSAVQSNARRLKWRHVALVYDGGSKVRFYMDGRQLTIVKISHGRSGTAQPRALQIGYRKYPIAYAGQFLGSMACMCIFERALSIQELQRLTPACP